MSDPTKPYRVAMREEGPMVNLYWTPADTMQGAQLVGCISSDIVHSSPELGHAFKVFAQCCAVELAKVRLGAKVIGVDVSDAPEHERAGKA